MNKVPPDATKDRILSEFDTVVGQTGRLLGGREP